MKQVENYIVKVVRTIDLIASEKWDVYANPHSELYNPFISHKFLNALEQSHSVGAQTGWVPNHFILADEADNELGYMPCYIKLHSRGEFVFDHGWANAYDGLGKQYYPKLQCAVPFTPVAVSKLLVKPGVSSEHYKKLLISGVVQFLEKSEISSLHLTFLSEQERDLLKDMGFLMRKDHQFHWTNQNYESFDAFLDSLSSRKRKAVRKERKEAQSHGLEIRCLTGGDLCKEYLDAFFNFYMDTSDRKWGIPYLNRDFFQRLNNDMKDNILLVLCFREGKAIAGALNFIGGDCLYGRYWGAIENYKCLHFEVCYYQAIEYAIQKGLKRVEAGAQGEHKLSRGYLPTTTYSAHYIDDDYMRSAIANFLEEEGQYVDMETEALSTKAPYAKI